MKRSQINQYIKDGEAFFAANKFALPKFASWTPADWKKHGPEIQGILECNLGWDICDFGWEDYEHYGLFLFTIRNGVNGSKKYPKPYAEKIMISKVNQITLMHCHLIKTEDIINRAGGKLSFELYNRLGNENKLDKETPVKVVRDGELVTLKPGEKISLDVGESLTLTPGLYHRFYAEEAPCMIGEVSFVNDDHTDNLFEEPTKRFPEIIEDEEPYRYIVGDYAKFGLI